ncbi:potassium-transporting ATPase subunit KdpC [Thermoflavimicrobium daqui]|uniref:Potassium-transporting ATPase KdpC subunit n=1 Tax=Thermoflavimicrobium daqui TaxID=2137476 RepID=A0A364K9U8_9BACL|nr:potassium-transporting ATPase subunit KdpC [Thermoflavimicrobium daqui]RAL27076.1 potassium-transporting ATPase subunit C [Thermoflavimicrobium daqui]
MKAFRMSLIMIVLCGLAFPLLMTGIAQILFPKQANGSILYNEKKQAIGSELIGQSFKNPKYFQGRVSSIEYDANGSGSKNYAPSNEEMIKRTQKDAEKWLKDHPGKTLKDVPLDLITNSGSGLDPHITPAAARFQIPKIIKANQGKVTEQQLEKLIQKHIEDRNIGVLGQPRVNVLLLNMDLQKVIQR